MSEGQRAEIEELRRTLRTIHRERTWAALLALVAAALVGVADEGGWTGPGSLPALLVAGGFIVLHGQVCAMRAEALSREIRRLAGF